MNKNERKSQAELINIVQSKEVEEFWEYMKCPPNKIFKEIYPEDWQPNRPILYKVGLGMGYLELPQGMPSYNCLVSLICFAFF